MGHVAAQSLFRRGRTISTAPHYKYESAFRGAVNSSCREIVVALSTPGNGLLFSGLAYIQMTCLKVPPSASSLILEAGHRRSQVESVDHLGAVVASNDAKEGAIAFAENHMPQWTNT